MADQNTLGYTISQFSQETLDLQAKTFCCGGSADNRKLVRFFKNTPFVSQNVGTIYSTAKWFVPASGQTLTVSSDGLSVTLANPVTNFQFLNTMPLSKIIVSGYERIINAFVSASVLTLASPLPSSLYNQVIAYTDWDIHLRKISEDASGGIAFSSIYGTNDKFTSGGDWTLSSGYLGNTTGVNFLPGILSFGSALQLVWSSTTATSGAKDTGLMRNSASVLEINTGTTGAFGDLKLRNIIATGTLTGTTASFSGLGTFSIGLTSNGATFTGSTFNSGFSAVFLAPANFVNGFTASSAYINGDLIFNNSYSNGGIPTVRTTGTTGGTGAGSVTYGSHGYGVDTSISGDGIALKNNIGTVLTINNTDLTTVFSGLSIFNSGLTALGATFTGSLIGTNATFSGNLTVNGTTNISGYTKTPISVTYAQLVNLKNNSQLIPLQTYLLNDYRTTYQCITGMVTDSWNVTAYTTFTAMGGASGATSTISGNIISVSLSSSSNYPTGNYYLSGGDNLAIVHVVNNGNGGIASVTYVSGGKGYNNGENQTILGADYSASVIITTEFQKYINENPIEQLIITATGVNTLETVCKSTTFGQDLVYYNIDDNTEGFTKGKIFRRIDRLQNNDIGTDWRHIKYRRFKINITTNWSNGTSYNIGDIVNYGNNIYYCYRLSSGWDNNLENFIRVFNNTINGQYVGKFFYDSNYSVGYCGLPIYDNNNGRTYNINAITTDYQDTLLFTSYSTSDVNNVISSYLMLNTVIQSTFYNNKISSMSDNNIFQNFNNNTIGSGFYTNNIGQSFTNNTIADGFNNNTVYEQFMYNNIGFAFSYNLIDYSFNSNIIGSYFSNNFIASYFISNVIGNKFNSNYEIGNNFNTNTISYGFSINYIKDQFSYNNISYSCSSNFIGNGFLGNTVGINFNGNEIDYGFTNNTISPNVNSNLIYRYLYNSIILTNVSGKDFSGISELYSKSYSHVISSTISKVKIEWIDDSGDTNIIII